MPVIFGKNTLRTEIYQSHIGTVNGTTIEGRTFYLGKTHVWPDYIINGVNGSLSTSNTSGDYLVTDKDPGISLNGDPNGENIYVQILNRESSRWHNLKVVIKTNNIRLSQITKYNDDKSEFFDYNYLNSDKYIIGSNDETLSNYDEKYDYILKFSLRKNSLSSNIDFQAQITDYYDELGNIITLDTPILLFKGTQAPNTGYFVHYALTSSSSNKIPTITNEFINTSALVGSTITIYLFVEFGISSTGKESDAIWNDSTIEGSIVPSNISDYITVNYDSKMINNVKIDSLQNSNYIPITLTFSKNTDVSDNSSYELKETKIQDSKNNITNQLNYENEFANITTELYEVKGAVSRSSTITINCSYPNYSFTLGA